LTEFADPAITTPEVEAMEEITAKLLLLAGLLAIGGICIVLAEVLCGMLDLPRVRATRDEYDEVQP